MLGYFLQLWGLSNHCCLYISSRGSGSFFMPCGHVHPSNQNLLLLCLSDNTYNPSMPNSWSNYFRPRLMFVGYFGLGRYLFFYLFFMVHLTLYSKTLPSHFLEGYQLEFDQPKYRIYILLMIPFLFTKGIFLNWDTLPKLPEGKLH